MASDFERLWDAHALPLLSFLTYRTGDRVLAEDLLGDTFERAFRARRRYDRRKASEKTWLYTIALNLLRDQQRRGTAEQRAVLRVGADAGDSVDAPDVLVEGRDEIQRGLARLSAEEREAIALRFGADLTVPEIAKVLGQPLTTVEGRVYRALRKLRAELDD
jgi:RNA polymerase sigma-70 factor (ECF subfamily)